MTVAQFCEAEQVSATNFYVWRKKISEERNDPQDKNTEKEPRLESEGTFLAVDLAMAPVDVRVLLPGGAVLELATGSSQEQLQQVITATVRATGQVTAESTDIQRSSDRQVNNRQVNNRQVNNRRYAC